MPAIAEKLVFDFANKDNKSLHEKLSEREYQVMILLAKGRSITEISKQLFISVNTISTYRTRVMEKLGMNKNAELTIYALRNNLID